MTTLGERWAAFDEHNLFFLAVLGLAGSGLRLDRLVEEFGAPPLGPVPLPPGDVQRDAFLCCMLGIVSLRESVRGHLTAAAATAVEATPPTREASPDGPAPCDLLR